MKTENLESMLADYRDLQAQLQPELDRLDALKRQIQDHVLETGETARIRGAEVTLRGAYTRESWDGKALAGYAAAHPEIERFRKVSTVSATAVLRISDKIAGPEPDRKAEEEDMDKNLAKKIAGLEAEAAVAASVAAVAADADLRRIYAGRAADLAEDAARMRESLAEELE